MAKRLLSKKTKSGVKKYQTAGYNMSGTSQALQNGANTTQKNPYMTEEQAAYEDKMFDYYGTKANKAKTDALRMQQEIEAANKEEVNSTLNSSANTLAKAAGKDMKAGTLGKFFVPKAVDAGLASSQAASTGVSAVAPTAASVGYAAPITTGIQSTAPSVLTSSAVAPSAGAVAFDTAAANTAATASQTAASTAPQMTNLASAGIGVGLNLAGTATERLTDDKSEYTNTKKERTGNIVGSGLKSAGTGVSIGTAVAGPIGGAIGGVIGAGVGVYKGIKENKANKKRADELQAEQSKLASAYQSSYVNSRLTGNDTGFGYNSSTNMNNNFTSSYFQAKLGGAKKLPGGYEVPIGPNGEVKYVGNTHKEGGIMESANTEVENQETKDMVMMNTGKPKEYFFSEYLKLGGVSFSKIHEDMVKARASQEQIQALAKKQEEVAGRNPKQVAMYGGPRKYQTAGPKEEETKQGGNTLSQDNATGEYVVRDANGNELSRSTSRRIAKRNASVKPQTTTTTAPTAWDGKVDTPQMAYDVNKPLLGKESMTSTEYLDAIDKYGMGVVDPERATWHSYLDSEKEFGKDEFPTENVENLTSPAYNNLEVVYSNNSRMTRSAYDQKVKEDNAKIQAERDKKLEEAAGNVTAASYGQPATTVAPATTVTPTPVVDATTTTTTTTDNTTATTTNQTPPQTPPASTTGTTITKEGATENDSKLIGAKDPNLLPQFENAKTNPIWSKDNYGSWKTRVNTALDNEATATEVANYISTYSGPYAEQVKRRAAGKTGAELVEIIREEATDNQPGIFHEAVRLALENTKPKEEPKKEDVKVEDVKDETPPQPPLPPRLQPCPTGQYRDAAGNCKQPMEPPADGINPTLIAGVSQLIPPIYGMVNRYQTAKGIPGIAGAAGIRGPLMPRVNLNRERDQSAKSNTAVRNFISSNNTGPGGIIAAMTANKDMNEQMLSIASKESAANKELAGEEAKLGMQASMFNAEQDLKRQGINADINQFNKKLEVGEKQYRREEIMGAIDTAVSRVAGVVKDERMYKATERLAKALDQTKSYDRYEVYEKFVKEKKKKGSPFANMSDYELRLMAAAIVGETTVVPPSGKEGEEGGDKKKLGGIKKYVSRLGDLKYNKVKV